MKFYKKLIGFMLVMVMVFAVSACSGESKSEQTPEDTVISETPPVEEIVETAKQKFKEASSYESEWTEDVELKYGLETGNTKTIINMISFDDPMKVKMNMIETDIAGDTEEMEWYIEKVDDNTVVYLEVLGDWYKQVDTEQDFFTKLAKEDDIVYIDAITELKQTGTEQVNGEDTIRYDGVIKGNDIRKIAEAQSVLAMVEESLEDTNVGLDEVYQDISDIPAFICINEQGYIVKLGMDLGDAVQDVAAKLTEGGNPDFDLEGISMEVKLSSTYKNFNQATEFEIPEEARDGEEI